MNFSLNDTGGIDAALVSTARQIWADEAIKAGIDLSGFDPGAPLADRIFWALSQQIDVAATYLRFSTNFQNSDGDQLRVNLEAAAARQMYIPPEFVCCDKAVSGKRDRRPGLDRLKRIMESGHVKSIFLFALSRLYRKAYRAMQFLNEEVVESALRAIVVSQDIDTANETSWKLKLQVHGIMDEMLTEAIAIHCREGLIGLFRAGYVTGRLPIWCFAKIVPDAPPTKLGKPRTAPALTEQVVNLICEHAQLHLDGMSLREGHRRWVAKGGPCPPDSRNGRISYDAYRAIWSNVRLTGLWEFGRTKSKYVSKCDYVRQFPQPEDQVVKLPCEELRVLSDDVFNALQVWLDSLKTGPHGPRGNKPLQLWDLTTEFFFCAACSKVAEKEGEEPVRLYQTGAQGRGMQCKNGDFCLATSAVRRKDAVLAVCEAISELIQKDSELLADAAVSAAELDKSSENALQTAIGTLERRHQKLSQQIEGLYDLAGGESESDRRETLARIRSAKAERAAVQAEVGQKRQALEQGAKSLTREDAGAILDESRILLLDAASGKLGEDAVYKALAIFREVTGGQIMVHVEKRPQRKQTNVRGVFQPQLLKFVKRQAGQSCHTDALGVEAIEVWLRKPPRVDLLAPRAYQLVIVEQMSIRQAAKVFQAEGHDINSGNVYSMLVRYYEMINVPMPKLPYNNGRPRKHDPE